MCKLHNVILSFQIINKFLPNRHVHKKLRVIYFFYINTTHRIQGISIRNNPLRALHCLVF